MRLEGPQLEVAVGAPFAAVEDQDHWAGAQNCGELDLLANLVRQDEVRGEFSDSRSAGREVDLVEPSGGAGESVEELGWSLSRHRLVHPVTLVCVCGGCSHVVSLSRGPGPGVGRSRPWRHGSDPVRRGYLTAMPAGVAPGGRATDPSSVS